ncbi:DEAD/DEAH box helicase family protein, partial [Klebsiella aerogenes]|uniref:hypothetical protein n=1 Tax=Klebsiella aerogenes TaxID=548 RepID=UPI001954FF97
EVWSSIALAMGSGVHERDLDTDFLLLVIKLELRRNPYLRVILMSATMDLNALSAYFGTVLE